MVDNDHSPLSKNLIRKLDAGSHAHVQAYDGGLDESLRRLRSAQDYALLSIPADFEADALAGNQPSVVLYYNALFYGAGLYSTQDFSGLMAEANGNYRSNHCRGHGQVAAAAGGCHPQLRQPVQC